MLHRLIPISSISHKSHWYVFEYLVQNTAFFVLMKLGVVCTCIGTTFLGLISTSHRRGCEGCVCVIKVSQSLPPLLLCVSLMLSHHFQYVYVCLLMFGIYARTLWCVHASSMLQLLTDQSVCVCAMNPGFVVCVCVCACNSRRSGRPVG